MVLVVRRSVLSNFMLLILSFSNVFFLRRKEEHRKLLKFNNFDENLLSYHQQKVLACISMSMGFRGGTEHSHLNASSFYFNNYVDTKDPNLLTSMKSHLLRLYCLFYFFVFFLFFVCLHIENKLENYLNLKLKK